MLVASRVSVEDTCSELTDSRVFDKIALLWFICSTPYLKDKNVWLLEFGYFRNEETVIIIENFRTVILNLDRVVQSNDVLTFITNSFNSYKC